MTAENATLKEDKAVVNNYYYANKVVKNRFDL